MLNMEEQTHRLESPEEDYGSPLNLNDRDDTTTFLPLDSRIGGKNIDCPTVGQYLTRD